MITIGLLIWANLCCLTIVSQLLGNEEADDPEESDGSIESPLPHAADIIKEPEGSQNEDCPPTRVLTTVELFARCEEKLTEKKETIATVTSQLLENPEGNVTETFIDEGFDRVLCFLHRLATSRSCVLCVPREIQM